MLVPRALLSAICALASLTRGVHGRDVKNQVVDLVLMVRESADMEIDHYMIRRQAGSIFETLRNETGGSFRVGLVGFGSRFSNGLPRRLGTLTEDLDRFTEALDLLSHDDESAQVAPAFRTIIGASTLTLDDGNFLDGSYQGRTFPGEHGFCAMMLTNAASSGDGDNFSTITAVTSALMGASSRRPSPFFAIVPPSEVDAENSFGAIARQTGGSAFSMSDFRQNDQVAATMLSQSCTDCARNIMQNAGCETNGPYWHVSNAIPAEFELEGNPQCQSGETLLMAFWTSPDEEVNLIQPTAPARVIIQQYGEYTVCQTVTCINSSSGETKSNTCCTNLALSPPGGLPTPNPPHFNSRPPPPPPYPTPTHPTPPYPAPYHTVPYNPPYHPPYPTPPYHPPYPIPSYNPPYHTAPYPYPTPPYHPPYPPPSYNPPYHTAPYPYPTPPYHAPVKVPTPNNSPLPKTPTSAPFDKEFPFLEEDNIICEPNGPYKLDAVKVPATITLNGDAGCFGDCTVIQAFWRTGISTDDVFFEDSSNPAKATITEFTIIAEIVCLVVDVRDNASGKVTSTECCTTIHLNEVKDKNPICDTNGPYIVSVGNNSTYPVKVDVTGRFECPFGFYIRDIEWISKTKDVTFNNSRALDKESLNRATAYVKKVGVFIICQKATCETLISNEIRSAECCTTIEIRGQRPPTKYPSVQPNDIQCHTNGPYYESASSLPATIILKGEAKCPYGFNLFDAVWSSRSGELQFPSPTNPATSIVSAYGNFPICQTVICWNQILKRQESKECCTTLSLKEGYKPTEPSYYAPSPPWYSPPHAAPTYGHPYPTQHKPNPAPYYPTPNGGGGILCDTQGPYESKSSELPGYTHLNGNSSCPVDYALVDAIWSSSSEHIIFPMSSDPGTVRISSYGSFIICQTVTCRQAYTGGLISEKCCTTLAHNQSTPEKRPSAAPDGIVCDAQGPYATRSETLPVFVNVAGRAVCPSGYKLYDSFWSSKSNEVMITEDGNITAMVNDFGTFEICQTVTCFNEETKLTTSIQCCTPLKLEEILPPSPPTGAPSPAPTLGLCETNGPYEAASATLPGYVHLDGDNNCPNGTTLVHAVWSSDSADVLLPITTDPATVRISSYGTFAACQTVTCRDTKGNLESTNCCTTVLLSEKGSVPSLAPFDSQAIVCDTKGPYKGKAYDLPGYIDLDGTSQCALGNKVFNVFWSSPSPEVVVPDGSDNVKAKVNGFGSYILCQTVTCLDPATRVTSSSQCCTTIDLQKSDSKSSKCDTYGPYRDSSNSLPGYIELFGSASCPSGDDVIDAYWESPSSEVEIEKSRAKIFDYGQYIVCQTIICGDRDSRTRSRNECCTTVELTEKDVPITCDIQGPISGSSASLPAWVDLYGSPSCPSEYVLSDSFWSSPSPDVEIYNSKAKLLDYGLFEVCQTVVCSDRVTGSKTKKECCTTIDFDDVNTEAPIVCDTQGPITAKTNALDLPGNVELYGAPVCPKGYYLSDSVWSSPSSQVEIHLSSAKLYDFGSFIVCQMVICTDQNSYKRSSKECCTTIHHDKGKKKKDPYPPSTGAPHYVSSPSPYHSTNATYHPTHAPYTPPSATPTATPYEPPSVSPTAAPFEPPSASPTAAPSKEPGPLPIGCDPNGPYEVTDSNLPAKAQVEGTGICPLGHQFVQTSWSSPTSELTILDPSNPAWVEVSSFGTFVVCQTVTCRDQSNDETHSAQCCTSLQVNEGATQKPEPPPEAVCEANGPYMANETSLPGFVDLYGNSSCLPGDLVVEAVWSSSSSEVTFPVDTAPERAQVYAFDTFVVCLTVLCLKDPSTETYSKECCTTLQLNQIHDAPNAAPKPDPNHETCNTEGPYTSESSYLPGIVEVSGSPDCPYGYDFLEAVWSSPSMDVKFLKREDPATIEVHTFGSSILCQTVICIDSTTGETSSKQCCTTIELKENHYTPNGPGRRPSYSPVALPTRPAYFPPPGPIVIEIDENLYTPNNPDHYTPDGPDHYLPDGPPMRPAYSPPPDPICDTNGPYTVGAPSLPSIIDISGSHQCPTGYNLLEVVWSSSSTEVKFPTRANPATVEVHTFGSFAICQTVICVDPLTSQTTSKQCCTTIDVKQNDAGGQEPMCDTGGPYSIYADSSRSVELNGSSSCPNGFAFLEATWFSDASEVGWDSYQNPARVRISTAGNYIVCQTVFCVNISSQETQSEECCTSIDVLDDRSDDSYTNYENNGNRDDSYAYGTGPGGSPGRGSSLKGMRNSMMR